MWLFHPLDADAVAEGEPAELVAVGTAITVRPADGDPLYETTVDCSSSRYFGCRSNHVQRYAVDIETDRLDETVDVPEERVDCDESNRAVLLGVERSVRSRGATTDVECRARTEQ